MARHNLTRAKKAFNLKIKDGLSFSVIAERLNFPSTDCAKKTFYRYRDKLVREKKRRDLLLKSCL